MCRLKIIDCRNQPLHDQFEWWTGFDDAILSILVTQGVQICLIDTDNGITSLKSSLICNASCINLLRRE